jgi:hypothetical protein
MTTDDPPAGDAAEPTLALSKLDDDALLDALRVALGQHDPPPRRSVEMAKAAFGMRSLDAELARLVSDSDLVTGQPALRSGRTSSRVVVFDAADLSVEVEIEPGAQAGSFRLVGLLTPGGIARIGVRQRQGDPVVVETDERGRSSNG